MVAFSADAGRGAAATTSTDNTNEVVTQRASLLMTEPPGTAVTRRDARHRCYPGVIRSNPGNPPGGGHPQVTSHVDPDASSVARSPGPLLSDAATNWCCTKSP